MVFQGANEYMIQLPIRVIAAEFVKILSRRDGAFGLAKCTVRVSTSGLSDFPPKPYKLDLIFFAISVIFLKMGKHSDYCNIRHASTTWNELVVPSN